MVTSPYPQLLLPALAGRTISEVGCCKFLVPGGNNIEEVSMGIVFVTKQNCVLLKDICNRCCCYKELSEVALMKSRDDRQHR